MAKDKAAPANIETSMTAAEIEAYFAGCEEVSSDFVGIFRAKVGDAIFGVLLDEPAPAVFARDEENPEAVLIRLSKPCWITYQSDKTDGKHIRQSKTGKYIFQRMAQPGETVVVGVFFKVRELLLGEKPGTELGFAITSQDEINGGKTMKKARCFVNPASRPKTTTTSAPALPAPGAAALAS